jgi:hypothetical protein
LAEALKTNNTLLALSLSGTQITDVGAKELAESLKFNNTLQTLILYRTQITDVVVKGVQVALKNNTNLKFEGRSADGPGDTGAVQEPPPLVAPNVQVPNMQDRVTDFLMAKMSWTKSKKVKGLLDRLRRNDTIQEALEHLLISNKEVDAKALAEALKTNNTLTTLFLCHNLGHNQITSVDAKELADALKTNTTLTSLHLYSNKISDMGAKELAEALKINNTLATLNLGINHISDAGAKELAVMIRTNNTLTDLI